MFKLPHSLIVAALACSLAACNSTSSQSAEGHGSSGVKASSTTATNAPANNAPGAKLDKDGYIHNWLTLGPINFGAANYVADDIDKDQIPNEANLTPKPGDKQKVKSLETQNGAQKMVDKEFTWTPQTTTDNFIDFNTIYKLDGSDSIGVYAVAYLDAPEEMKDLKFSLSSNDDGKIFLNGKKVWSLVVGRALEPDSDVVDNITLHKGTNTLIFKVWNDSSNWQACLRLLTKDGKPVTNVTVKMSK